MSIRMDESPEVEAKRRKDELIAGKVRYAKQCATKYANRILDSGIVVVDAVLAASTFRVVGVNAALIEYATLEARKVIERKLKHD